nr:replication protein A 70 kDa DNA-binding subunit B [Tanacetum cinerariifolium]
MATFVSCYISDLSPVKDNIKLRVRILRAWLQPLYNNQQVKNMTMIVMDDHGVQSIIVGTVIAIQEDECWWCLGCRACRGKDINSTDYIDLESEMPKETDRPNDWWCRKCNAWVALIKSQMRLGQRRCRFSTMRFRLWLVALLINYVKNMQSTKDDKEFTVVKILAILLGSKDKAKSKTRDWLTNTTLLSELSNEAGFLVTNMSFDALLESLLLTAKPFPQSAGYRILAF